MKVNLTLIKLKNIDKMDKYINKNLGELPIHQLLQQLSSNDLLWDLDALSLCLSGLSDEKSLYPRTESGYAYTKDMNDEFVESFNESNFTQGSAILKIKHYNPKNLIVQHIPVKDKVKKQKLIE